MPTSCVDHYLMQYMFYQSSPVHILSRAESNAVLSVVDRNGAIFKTRQAITCYEFQVSQGKL